MPRRPLCKSRPVSDTVAASPLVLKGMVRMAPTMSVPELLRERGVDPAALLAEFGLCTADFDQPEHTLSFATRSRLLARCAEVTQCPHFGLLVGQRAGISMFGAVGFLMQSAPDVRSALQIATHRFRLHNPNAAAVLVESGASVALSLTVLGAAVTDHRQTLDLAAAMTFNAMRALCGHDWWPTEVRFAHARPRNLAPFRQFFRAPLVFDTGDASMSFARHWLDRPLASADPLLHLMMRQRVDELDRQSREGLASQLSRILPSLITARSASVELAAQQVGLGVRTLNRRLAADGSSFRELREQVRYDIAQQLLQGTRMPIGAVADHLGYANASAFTCAFRRWSGKAPAQWRASRSRQTRLR